MYRSCHQWLPTAIAPHFAVLSYLATDSLHLGADDALKARILPRAAAGVLGAFALTEPEAGSNPADMRTIARREGAGYRIRGTKAFIWVILNLCGAEEAFGP